MSQLKARLSEWLGKLRAGRSVIITDRGKPVARLEPVGWQDDPEGQLAALVSAGLARAPEHTLRKQFFEEPRPQDPEATVLRALLDERRNSR